MKDLIQSVTARWILDSRANPTVEVDIRLQSGAVGRGMVPSGASTGMFEALELRDGGERFGGKGVEQAIRNIREILAPAITGMDALDQQGVDRRMIETDGTDNKSRLGANAILGCSIAVAYAAAASKGQPLYRSLCGGGEVTIPVPMIQIIGGGAHAKNTTDIQDYLVIPTGAGCFSEALEMVVGVYRAAAKVFEKRGKPLAVADEGGFWPTGFRANEEGLALLTEAIETAGYRPMTEVAIALDIASSEFYDGASGRYRLALDKKELSEAEMVALMEDWVARYPILSIEDGCAETDWAGSKRLTERLGGRVQLIGDDLFTTNEARIRRGVEQKICNAVLIKMNQIGSVTETLRAIDLTKASGYLPVVSARSGETEDATISHLAAASGAGQLKVGSVARSERNAKWNELLRMEQELGDRAVYAADIFSKILK